MSHEPRPCTTQVRRYGIADDDYDFWLEWWRTSMVAARESFGFRVIGGWALRDTSEFFWIVSAPVARQDFESYDAAWRASPQFAESIGSAPAQLTKVSYEFAELP